jgi:thiamine monophosphate synthase
LRARFIARAVSTPIYALGGVDTHSAKKLAGARLAGLAAVGALGGEHQPSQSACGCAVLVTTV